VDVLGVLISMAAVILVAGKVAGVIAAVVRHGKLAFVASAGTLDPENARPVNEDAVFRIFSMTKPITTVAVMQMYERGKLRLDDPVSRYIPAFGRTRVYAGGGAAHPALRDPARPITIADLLTHTAGLTYGFFGNTPVDSIYRGAQLFNPNWTIAQFSDSLARLPLAFSPGTAWNYSLALDVLGRVVEVVSGMPFDRYLDSAVFRPLGMRSTAFHATAAMEGNITAYYVRAEDGKGVLGGMGRSTYGTPLVAEDVVYFGDRAVRAVRLTASLAAQELWSSEMPGDVFGSPLLHDGVPVPCPLFQLVGPGLAGGHGEGAESGRGAADARGGREVQPVPRQAAPRPVESGGRRTARNRRQRVHPGLRRGLPGQGDHG